MEFPAIESPANPLEPTKGLKPGSHLANGDQPQATDQPPLPEDSATSKAEKVEWNAASQDDTGSKRKRDADEAIDATPRKKGVAPIQAEFLLNGNPTQDADQFRPGDTREARDAQADGGNKRKKQKGQNTKRSFGSSRDTIQLCATRATQPEFSPNHCSFGESCKYEHDLRKYLQQGKRTDLKTFEKCPVWEAKGRCRAGWRCRFAMSHAEERKLDDGKNELVLLDNGSQHGLETVVQQDEADNDADIVNIATPEHRKKLMKRNISTPKADEYTKFLNKITNSEKVVSQSEGRNHNKSVSEDPTNEAARVDVEGADRDGDAEHEARDMNASYIEPKLRPSEKRRLYFGPETPVLAPLTTQGNLPFRKLCVGLGAQVTWSEMAMSLPLIQGQKQEWALLKAHQLELESPKYSPFEGNAVPEGYDNTRDFKFGAQISANKPWLALKATEVFREGAGSALMDSPAKLERILRGMNAVSGDVPIQAKIRTGTKDNKPTADRLIERLAFGGTEAERQGLGPPGVAAITLHGRSRQQRYTKQANWSYIAECASLVKSYNSKLSNRVDTNKGQDLQDINASERMYFIGNGDCYSHVDYYNHIEQAKVDSVMIARGALIKPWIFEEISAGQYLDKSSSERLRYVEQFVRNGLSCWGSDEIGVGTTRRFLLEWLSFACRYVPIGLLEHLPPSMNDRPPAYRGRDDLETLMASDNVKDWIKISEMFLGPAHENFKFDPKHKSNSYDKDGDYTAEG
ncbi:MAG: hypothetical protein Q9162_005424 [Coniocarpon cinnabarinum]